ASRDGGRSFERVYHYQAGSSAYVFHPRIGLLPDFETQAKANVTNVDADSVYLLFTRLSNDGNSILFTKSMDGGKSFPGFSLNYLPFPIVEPSVGITVDEGDMVLLDASKSYDPEMAELTYYWQALTGPPINLSSENNTSTISFVAPDVAKESTIMMLVLANDGIDQSFPTYVNVTVRNVENHFVLIHGGEARLEGEHDDFPAGYYFASVNVSVSYLFENDDEPIIDMGSGNGTLTMRYWAGEGANEVDKFKLPVKIKEMNISDDKSLLSYTLELMSVEVSAVQGEISGVIRYDQPIDFVSQETRYSDSAENEIVLDIEGIPFDTTNTNSGSWIYFHDSL
ncbi:MAG: hypothetical protein ACREBU_24430, partial [Nitrososphaera sp.]